MEDPTSEIVKALPPDVVQAVYTDGVKGVLTEIGALGVDFVKTARLLLLPVQYAAYLQDKLASKFKRAVEMVPPERVVTPVQSLALGITERLRLEADESPIAEMYVKLLARAMDRERVGEAHPAFVQIIGQLAPDEIALFEQIAVKNPAVYLSHHPKEYMSATSDALRELPVWFEDVAHNEFHVERILDSRNIAEPFLCQTYVQHLASLNLITWQTRTDFPTKIRKDRFAIQYLMLNEFGSLFRKACIDN